MAYNAYASIDPNKIDPNKVVQLGPTGGERFSLYGPLQNEWLTQKGAVGTSSTPKPPYKVPDGSVSPNAR